MKVLKFGGSSVGSPERIRKVKKIIEGIDSKTVIVVSAFEGVTDQLETLSNMAASRQKEFKDKYADLRKRHIDTVNALITSSKKTTVLTQVETLLDELINLLEGIYLLNDLSPKIHDRILSYGELLSSIIISEVINGAKFIDSRELIKTDSNYGSAQVDFTLTNDLISKHFDSNANVFIAPGFIATDKSGNVTTLGRGGSDYSASIYAAALNAEILEIWTDVDGFMTADPRKVSKAFAIENLSYSEAMELSHFGARVVYTPTIQPVLLKRIPIKIKNTFSPSLNGTLISSSTPSFHGISPIKGVSSIDDIDLITLQGPGMVGVKGISSRLFGALAQAGVNIIMITQASSEYSITFAINPTDTRPALDALDEAFQAEIHLRHELYILVERDLSIIAIVGEGMKNTPGISATLFRSLGRNGISVIATAQGSSELNISVVIRKDNLKKALNAIHEGFFLSHYKELHLYLVGIGTVGGSLLSQIKSQQKYLMEEHKLKVNVIGICRSKKMILKEDGINLEEYRHQLENEGEIADLDKFMGAIKHFNLRNSVFIDCTADEMVAMKYQKALDNYISVVTANKVACSSDYSLYKSLKQTAVNHNVKFMYETNVGAGLPIINTINDLTRSGDRVLHMEAVLSGTLNFIFNVLSEEVSLSKAIRMAKEKGFSEPDPRIDLSGIDVVRKILILGRESGYQIEQKDVKIETFLPKECFEGSLEDFWEKVSKYDLDFENRRKQLVAQGKRWRFVAKLDCGQASIGLQEVDANHPAYNLEGSNNILLLTTDRYHDEPMVIRGYGAGAEVTAAGVFADAIRVANV